MSDTASTLLYKVLDFMSLVPNPESWSEPAVAYNEPRLIRFRQIIAMFRAFGIVKNGDERKGFFSSLISKITKKEEDPKPNEIQAFLRGEFINGRDLKDYAEIVEIIREYSDSERIPIDLREISRFYAHLIRYYIAVSKVLSHNSNYYEASYPGLVAALHLTSYTNQAIREKTENITEILLQIIDPQKRSFTEEELISKYGYPKKNLDEVDADNY